MIFTFYSCLIVVLTKFKIIGLVLWELYEKTYQMVLKTAKIYQLHDFDPDSVHMFKEDKVAPNFFLLILI